MRRGKAVLIAYALLVLAAFFVRLYAIDSYVLHHDEGVIGFFSMQLFKGYGYHYDPFNYHGPSLYYLNLIPFFLFGLSNFSLRFIPAVFGAALLLLLYPLRKYFGNVFLLAGSAFLAFSPTMVYYSRYAIHEMLFVFFTFSTFVSFYLYTREKKPFFLYCTAISSALLLSTKETGYFTLFVFASFLAIFFFYNHKKRNAKKHGIETKHVLASVLFFLLIYFTLFSSFFTDIDGITRSFSASLPHYIDLVAFKGVHCKPFPYYFDLLLSYELPVLILALCAILFCFRHRDTVLFFLSYWFLLTFFGYSATPYKTPWLIVDITLPMLLLAAYFLQKIYKKERLLNFIILVTLVCAFLSYYTIQTSFIHFSEDEHNKLAYAHTNKDIYNLLSWLETGSKQVPIKIQTDSYGQWPLPWYFELAGYSIARDSNLWDYITTNESNCLSKGYQANPKIVREIESRLAELGHPLILGYAKELQCFSATCYKRKDYQLRNNLWISLFFRNCGNLENSAE
jgi:uncharacterized protein (TIGR03663 family)